MIEDHKKFIDKCLSREHLDLLRSEIKSVKNGFAGADSLARKPAVSVSTFPRELTNSNLERVKLLNYINARHNLLTMYDIISLKEFNEKETLMNLKDIHR
jgi:hypothetical protein